MEHMNHPLGKQIISKPLLQQVKPVNNNNSHILHFMVSALSSCKSRSVYDGCGRCCTVKVRNHRLDSCQTLRPSYAFLVSTSSTLGVLRPELIYVSTVR